MSLIPIPALSSALQGLRSSIRRIDRAAADVARAGLPVADEATAEAPLQLPPNVPAPGQPIDLADSMTEILLAQRGYFAQLRLIEASRRMEQEALDRLGGDEPA